ncbi:unnamed protein product, partial [Durusdinium trenchii]
TCVNSSPVATGPVESRRSRSWFLGFAWTKREVTTKCGRSHTEFGWFGSSHPGRARGSDVTFGEPVSSFLRDRDRLFKVFIGRNLEKEKWRRLFEKCQLGLLDEP